MAQGFEKFEYPNNKTTGWFKITHILFTVLVFFLDYIISGEMFWNRIGISVLIMVSAFMVSFLSWVFEKSLNKSVKMFWNSNLFDYLLTSFEKPQKRKKLCLSLILPNILVLFPLILVWMLTYEEPFVSRAFFDIWFMPYMLIIVPKINLFFHLLKSTKKDDLFIKIEGSYYVKK